jgi:NMD protein affecting ribosome stability and mRNA decay
MKTYYCCKCGNPINGFDYGVGFNSICGNCNQKEKLIRLEEKKLQLEINLLEKNLKLK